MSGKQSKLALFISIVLVFPTLFGCGSKDSGNDSAATTAAGESTAAGVTVKEEVKEPVTLTIMGSNLISGNAMDGLQTDPVAKEIERLIGVTMNIISMQSQNDFKAKVQAMAVSGDLPDIVQFDAGDNTFVQKIMSVLIKSDSIISLDELVKTNGQNWLNNPRLKFNLEYNKKFVSNGENKLYFIPTNAGYQSNLGNPFVAGYIRWDYYKEIGYPQVKSPEDLINVLSQIQKNHPKAPNGKNAYGLSFWVDWGYELPAELIMLDGYLNNSILEVDISNNEVKPLFDKDSSFWKWTRFIYDAKQKGILDPDSYTMKYDQWTSKLKAGEMYFMTTGWNAYALEGEAEQGFAPLDYIEEGSNKTDVNYGNAAGQRYNYISRNCKYPERAMDFFNFLGSDEGMTLIYNGIEGQTWDMVEGKPQFKQEVMDERNKPNGGKSGELYGFKYAVFPALTGLQINPSTNRPYDFLQSSEYVQQTMRPYETDCARHYNVNTLGEIFKKYEFNGYLNPIGNAMPGAEGDIKVALDKINEYTANNWAKPILAKNDAEFEALRDQFIKDLYDMGFKQVYDWMAAAWNETKTNVEAMGGLPD